MAAQAPPVLAPRTADEAASMLRETYASGPIAFAGGGTHTIVARAARHTPLSTYGLDRIVEYAPEDQTVTVEAGVTIAALNAALAERGQRAVIDVAEPRRATVGGAIAANVYGPRRQRFGSLKDLILGVSLVRSDGVRARAGGTVVKNVAGFDLSKLVVGSHGTLALIAAATLRVHPLPAAAVGARVAGLAPDSVWQFVRALRERQLEPAAAVAVRRTGENGYDLDVLFEGFASGVTSQVTTLRALAARRDLRVDDIAPDAMLAADARLRAGGPLRVRCIVKPAEFAATERLAIAPLCGTLLQPTANAYPALGIFTLAGVPTASSVAMLQAVRMLLARSGGSAIVEAQPVAGASWQTVEPWGEPPPAFGIMTEIKQRFDPDGRLCAGRFVGGL